MSLDGKLANEYEFSASLDLDQVEEFQSFEDWKIFFQEGESYRLQMDPKISEDPFFIVARLKEVKSYLTYLELHFVPLEPSEKFLLLLKDPQSKNPKTESKIGRAHV